MYCQMQAAGTTSVPDYHTCKEYIMVFAMCIFVSLLLMATTICLKYYFILHIYQSMGHHSVCPKNIDVIRLKEKRHYEFSSSTSLPLLPPNRGKTGAVPPRVHLHPLKSSSGCNAPVLRAIFSTMKLQKREN